MAILNLIKRQLRSAIEWQNQKTGCPVPAMSGGNKKKRLRSLAGRDRVVFLSISTTRSCYPSAMFN
jgi:hypothetical protein